MRYVVIGLGNPGKQYSSNRHNVGFQVVDRIAERLGAEFSKYLLKRFLIAKATYKGHQIFLVKPLTFMNNSGEVLKSVLQFTNATLEDVIVVSDNMDFPPGTCRLKPKGSSPGHNGITSVIEHAGTEEFWRLYLGIGRPEGRKDVIAHVLGDPSKEEEPLYRHAVELAADSILRIAETSHQTVMNEINRKYQDRIE